MSGDATYRKHVVQMADFLIAELTQLGATDIQREELGKQVLDGQEIDLPPAVLATYGARLSSSISATIRLPALLLTLSLHLLALVVGQQGPTLARRQSSSMVRPLGVRTLHLTVAMRSPSTDK